MHNPICEQAGSLWLTLNNNWPVAYSQNEADLNIFTDGHRHFNKSKTPQNMNSSTLQTHAFSWEHYLKIYILLSFHSLIEVSQQHQPHYCRWYLWFWWWWWTLHSVLTPKGERNTPSISETSSMSFEREAKTMNYTVFKWDLIISLSICQH